MVNPQANIQLKTWNNVRLVFPGEAQRIRCQNFNLYFVFLELPGVTKDSSQPISCNTVVTCTESVDGKKIKHQLI